MSRSRVLVSLLMLSGVTLLAAGGPVPEPRGTELDPHGGASAEGFEDPFADGDVPDLLVLASGDALGETIPCG